MNRAIIIGMGHIVSGKEHPQRTQPVSGWENICPYVHGCKDAKDAETFNNICSRGERIYRECRGET